ncbi:hypothetical protein JXL21_00915 [Candidatus Bathyarchaeota archaeon]|nr:hypothetical protein [Candidatus Bathyarchaeota archaeon]
MKRADAKALSLYKAAVLLTAFLVAVSYIDVRRRTTPQETVTRVAYIDPLYRDGSGFYEETRTLFSRPGYVFDATLGENVTVEFLKRLPKGYDVIVLRVHSTVNDGMVWFFTGEEYAQNKYVLEQLVDEVHPARPSLESKHLFAVGADFVKHFMEDRFSDALVLLMGCDGLKSTDLARAFTDNGAEAYVSWDGPVSLEHTDRAFQSFLEAMVNEGMTVEEALAHSMRAVGCDPDYNSSLMRYPAVK